MSTSPSLTPSAPPAAARGPHALRRLRLLLPLALALSCAGKGGGGGGPMPPPPGASAAPAAAPGAPVAAADPDAAPLPVDRATRVVVLDNGLRVYLRKHGKPEKRASLRLVVNAGSVLETEEQRGLAHFVEHMAFNGTRLFRKQEIVDYLERVGMRFGQDANASTSFDETIYTFEVPTDDAQILDKGLVILQQMAHEVSFDPDEVEREKKVVIEEWRLGRGAGMRVMEQILPVIFKGSRYAERLPIGTKEVLERTTSQDLRRFYEAWYRPDLMALVAVGDFDDKAVEARIREIFGKIPKPPAATQRPAYPVPDHAETLVAVGQDKEMPTTMVGVIHKQPHRPDLSARDYRRGIVEGLYHDMMNARLDDLTRAEDPPFLGAGSTTQSLVRPIDAFTQIAGVRQDRIARGLDALTREVERIDRHGFTDGELERAKTERLRRMEALVTEQDKVPSAGFADEMVRNFLTGEAMPGIEAELALHRRFLPSIALPEMNRVAREWIGEKNRVILVQAPQAASVPAPAALRATFDGVQKEQIAAYVDEVKEGPLLPTLPAPGRIEKERRIDEIGVSEWRLSNGVTVVVKPTDFKNDEVLVSASSPGGHSLVPDRSYLPALFSSEIVGASGLGQFDPAALRKALAGKLASADPYLSELEEGVAGRASPKDLESLFQLVYLTFTAPRRDERVFAAFQAQLGESLSRRDVQPDAVFMDERERVIYANHPRRRPLEPGDEKKVALDEVLRIYKQRFADAGDFTFTFVGRVDPETLKPLVLKYLGALPGKAKGKREKWRDVGARPIPGEKRFDVKKGIEPRSTVSLTFTGPARWTREEDHLVDSLVEAIGIRLREEIREELGATYGVRVSGGLVRRPREAYRIDVVFSCAPDRVDQAIAAVWKEIDKARTGGLGPAYVEKVQAAQRRALEEGERTNGFWLAHLADHYRHGTDPRQILEQRKLIDALTAARLQTAVGRYFDKNGYVLGVLKPDGAPAAAAAPLPAGAR